MFSYIDETGNTGTNLFDPNQPYFMTAALITKSNFDLLYKKIIKKLAEKVNTDVIHSNVLGLANIDVIASDLLKIVKKSDARFFIGRVVKRDLAITKMVDTLFDSAENRAVPWLIYNSKPLRLLIVMKLAYLLNRDIIERFWNCLIEPSEEKTYKNFRLILQELLPRVSSLPDERSRKIISEAIQWAIDNPEAIHLHADTKAMRNGHAPNIVVFTEILGEIERKSKVWGRDVVEIVHDRQSQFGPLLKKFHDLFSNATPGAITLLGGETLEVRRVAGSKLRISSAEESPGIQLIDTILWLYKRILDSKPLSYETARLMRNALSRCRFYDLSLDSISSGLSSRLEEMADAPITEEQLERAKGLLEFDENRRQVNMQQYYMKKLNDETS